MQKYHAKVHGVLPLLHHKFQQAGFGQKVRKSTVFNPKEEAEKCLYRNPKTGKIYQPAEHLEGAMIKGAANIQLKGKKTFKSIAAQLQVSPREISISQEYEIDQTTGVIPATRGRVNIARPRWDEWELEFDVIDPSNPADTDEDRMRQILDEAGKQGIGTFRLKYGHFIVDEVKKV